MSNLETIASKPLPLTKIQAVEYRRTNYLFGKLFSVTFNEIRLIARDGCRGTGTTEERLQRCGELADVFHNASTVLASYGYSLEELEQLRICAQSYQKTFSDSPPFTKLIDDIIFSLGATKNS